MNEAGIAYLFWFTIHVRCILIQPITLERVIEALTRPFPNIFVISLYTIAGTAGSKFELTFITCR
jgi:hypothetical protein